MNALSSHSFSSTLISQAPTPVSTFFPASLWGILMENITGVSNPVHGQFWLPRICMKTIFCYLIILTTATLHLGTRRITVLINNNVPWRWMWLSRLINKSKSFQIISRHLSDLGRRGVVHLGGGREWGVLNTQFSKNMLTFFFPVTTWREEGISGTHLLEH